VNPKAQPKSRRGITRRAFLRGAGAVTVGLPFLEGLPLRSAWAQAENPVFTFFVVGQNGVVHSNFFPSGTGALTTASLGADPDIATSVLAPHAANLLFVKNINYPIIGRSCGHAEGNVQTLTGLEPGSSGNQAHSSGPSADTLIANALDDGRDPLALYSGAKGFIAERISFKAAGAGQVRAADVNPYLLYSKVVGLAGGATMQPPTGGPMVNPIAQQIANNRQSVNDYVGEELKALRNRSELSMADRLRLDQHFDAIRDVETGMDEIVTPSLEEACFLGNLPVDKYEAYRSGFAFQGDQMEEYVRLHLQVMAVAFGCNYSRVATLQWGDGTDGTRYDVPSNSGLGWSFHQLSHRIESDSATGNNPTAEAAHHEIDIVHMETLLVGLDAFKAHGLENNAQIIWTNTIADGPSHSTRGVPMIVWGSGGGYLKQGTSIDADGAPNAAVLNTLMAAATRDVTPDAPMIASGTFDEMKV
jgi:hypothetical protein